MSTTLGPVTLEGEFVRLEPLRTNRLDGLVEAARAEQIWDWLPQRPGDAEAMRRFIAEAEAAEAAGREYAFCVINQADGRVVGSTRFMDVAPDSRGVEIGWTWYTPDVWGTQVNPEAKLLLMRHAFDEWAAIRVYFKTDARNARSRAAILKLGAQFEGVLRNHRIRPDGSYRDSAVYSVIDREWPAVRAGLEARLDGSA